MGKSKYLITYAYDKKNRAILPDKKGNFLTFKTRVAAKKEIDRRLSKPSYAQGKIRNPRIVSARKRGA